MVHLILEDKRIQSVRHVMRPNLSYSYTPSFEKYYDTMRRMQQVQF
jgi:hypothetical protein